MINSVKTASKQHESALKWRWSCTSIIDEPKLGTMEAPIAGPTLPLLVSTSRMWNKAGCPPLSTTIESPGVTVPYLLSSS